MRAIITIILAALILQGWAQNLVPNPSFEIIDTCPDNVTQLNRARSWYNPNEYTTPDLFTPCATNTIVQTPYNYLGFQPARTGTAYAGIMTFISGSIHNRECISVQLIDSLEKDSSYCVSFFVASADHPNIRITSDGIALFLSSDSIYAQTNTYLNYPAQIRQKQGLVINDTTGWTKVSGVYVANGGEKYLTIGCFWDENDITWEWRDLPGSPAVEYLYIDDVSVEKCNEGQSLYDSITRPSYIYPNPSTGSFIFSAEPGGTLKLYNYAGQHVFSEQINSTQHELSPFLEAGIYIWSYEVGELVVGMGKLVLVE